jgi:hypothetical protein
MCGKEVSMIIAFLFSAWQLEAASAVPETADCHAESEVRGSRIMRVVFDCPEAATDAAGLQTYADRVAAQIEVPLDLRRLQTGRVAPAVTFSLTEAGWVLETAAPFLQTGPRYVPSAARRGVDARCDTLYWIGSSGRAQDIEVVCQAFRPDGTPVRHRGFVNASQDSLERRRWFVPADADAICMTTEFVFQLADGGDGGSHLSEPVQGAPTCP